MGSRELLLKFWDSHISEWLELEMSNFACRFVTGGSNERNAKLGQRGSERGYVTYFWHFRTLSISRERLELETSNLACRFMTKVTNERNTKQEDEIANVKFLYDDIVHTAKYNRLVNKFCHRSTRLRGRTQVYQIHWNNAMQQPLRRSRSFKVTGLGTNGKFIYDFLLVINTNLPPILHRFHVMADYWSNFR